MNELQLEFNKKLIGQVGAEWFAIVQYQIAGNIAKGRMRSAIAADFIENMNEELGHLQKISNRMMQLKLEIPNHPYQWFETSKCKYIVPNEPNVKELLKQQLVSEQCAIKEYTNLITLSREMNDYVSYDLFSDILEEEVEHEFEVNSFLADLSEIQKEEMQHNEDFIQKLALEVKRQNIKDDSK